MKKNRVIVYTLLILSIGLVGIFISKLNTEEVESFIHKFENDSNHKEIVGGYSFEKIDSNVINKEFDGDYLDSFVTVALEQDEFSVNLKGIDSGRNVFIINPNNGEMISIQNNNGVFSGIINLESDINYGIIMDYKLIGSIRVVKNLNDIDDNKLFRNILIGLGCGL